MGKSVILSVLALGAVTGWFFVHARARSDRPLLVLTLVLDVIVGGLAAMATWAEPAFELSMQEDGWAEWATVYAFSFAAVLIVARLLRWRRTPEAEGWLAPLGLASVALFCVFVAGEEISWGQRLLAFQPPEMFLRENFQQELNVHNLLTKKTIAGFKLDSRFLVAVIAITYGGIVPALRRWVPLGPLQSTFDVVAPRWSLAPWFAIVALVELSYPAELAGEACELVLGMLFVAAALVHHGWPTEPTEIPSRKSLVLLVAPLGLGVITEPIVSRVVYGADEDLVVQAQQELEALRDDLMAPEVLHRKLGKKRRVHKRVFTAVVAGYFDPDAPLAVLGGAPSAASDAKDSRRDRLGYFLDPWNNPYWILTSKKGHRGVLYSFGPNRRRDTKMPKRVPKNLQAAGDDIVVPFDLKP